MQEQKALSIVIAALIITLLSGVLNILFYQDGQELLSENTAQILQISQLQIDNKALRSALTEQQHLYDEIIKGYAANKKQAETKIAELEMVRISLQRTIRKQVDSTLEQNDAAINTITALKKGNYLLQKKLSEQKELTNKYEDALNANKKEREFKRLVDTKITSDKLFRATLAVWYDYQSFQPFQVDMIDKKILKMLLVNHRFRNLDLYESSWGDKGIWYFENKYGVSFYTNPITAQDYVEKSLHEFQNYLINNKQFKAGKIADKLKAIFQNDEILYTKYRPILQLIQVGHGNLYDYLQSDYVTASEIPAGVFFKNNNPWTTVQVK